MELETMKTFWKKESEDHFQNEKLEPEEIQSLMKSKSNTTLAQIKSTMRVKMWVAGISMIVALLLSAGQLLHWFSNPLFFSEILTLTEAGVIFLLMGGVIAAVMAGNIWNYLSINRFEQTSHNLRIRLLKTAEILKQVMRLGVYSDVVFIPLISGFIGYRWLYGSELFAFDIRFSYLVLLVVASSYGSYLIAGRLMKRKYGRELEQLKSYIRELDPHR